MIKLLENMKKKIRIYYFFYISSFLLVFILYNPIASYAFEEVKFEQQLNNGLVRPVDVSVASTGNIYVLDKEQCKVQVFKKNGESLLHFGERGSLEAQLSNPNSLAISPAGQIIVADTGNNRIQLYDMKGKFLFQFGSAGSMPGQFKSPSGIVVDQFGFIFVADKDNRRIQVFSPNGVFLRAFPTEYRPIDIGISPSRYLYVLMPEIGQIVKYSTQGKQLKMIRCFMHSKNYVLEADNIALDTRGDIYISDNSESSIKKFDENEKILISFGSKGEGRGQFDKALGIYADQAGKLYIADHNNGRVQIFKIRGSQKEVVPYENVSPLVVDFYNSISVEESIVGLYARSGQGVYVLSEMESHIIHKDKEDQIFGQLGKDPGDFFRPMAINVTLDGNIYTADSGNNRIQIINADGTLNYHFGKSGYKAGQFSSPQGIGVNSKGLIYVSDTQNHRIQIFTNDGIYIGSFGQNKNMKRDSPGILHYPKSLAINSKDQVYILDYENTRIQVFDEDGRFLRIIGKRGSGLGEFERPSDIFLDENDNLYVADQGNYRIQIFNAQGEFILSFGAQGDGRGYFREISAISAADSKIYVADYRSQIIQVFRYSPEGLTRKNRIYTTKVVAPPAQLDENSVVKYTLAKKQAIEQGTRELFGNYQYSKEYLSRFIKIESVETISNGQVKVTVSFPREIPPEGNNSEAALSKGVIK